MRALAPHTTEPIEITAPNLTPKQRARAIRECIALIRANKRTTIATPTNDSRDKAA